MKQVFTIIFFVFALLSQAQTFTRVSDINPSGDADFEGQILFQGKIFFAGNDGTNSGGLYFTDGTTSGTQLISGTQNVVVSSSQNLVFVECNSKLFFVADDGTHGQELWVTDGTSGGTQMVKDIVTGIGNAQIQGLRYASASFQNKLYFVANDGANGSEVWVSDGTSSGTQLLKDINSGNASSSPGNFVVYNNLLYFSADNGANGTELWVSDGTTNGTTMFADLSNQQYTSISTMVWNNKLWFTETTLSQFDSEIFISDGTFSGTHKLSDSIPALTNKKQGWDSYPQSPLVINNKLIVVVSDTVYYITDGTAVGSQMCPWTGYSHMYNSIVSNNRWFYNGSGGLRVTDGVSIDSLIFPGSAGNFVEVNGHLCFLSTLGTFGNEPWVTDGTTAGTVRLKDVCPGNCDLVSTSGHWRFIHYGGKLYFEGDNSTGYSDLWVTDGTPSGTQKLTPSSQTNSNTYIDVEARYGGIVYNNCLYFAANYDNAGNELWKYCDATSGISDVIEFSLNIYPNPTTDKLFIETNDLTITEINIYSATGSLVLNEKLSHNSIDISPLMTGVYVAEIKNTEASVMRRFVKM